MTSTLEAGTSTCLLPAICLLPALPYCCKRAVGVRA
jgi:hypothetical protein